MARPQVTITLGRSGQVVRRPLDSFDGSRYDAPASSGSKRSVANGYSEDTSSYARKRLQVGVIRVNGSSSGYSGPAFNIGKNDLRLKLLRKRSKQTELHIEERKKRELQEKISRTIQSSEAPERFLLRNDSLARRAGESSQMESVRTSYSSSTIDGSRLRSQQRVPQNFGAMPSSRPMGQVLHPLQPMPALASRTGLFQQPHSKGPPPMTVIRARIRSGLDPHKPMKESVAASSSMTKTPYLDEHLTVGSLLNALGLGKYAIIFQAEEVDMAALKQMGDRDLKELGIPMGPRKKILLAMLSQSKRPTA